jgi:bla regulator protein blaR1
MGTHFADRGTTRRILLSEVLILICTGTFLAPVWSARPQDSGTDWQDAAGGRMEFDSASVNRNTTSAPSARGSSIPLGLGDVSIQGSSRFTAGNHPLLDYIAFAYKITDGQEHLMLPQVPEWVVTDRFDIVGNARGNPSKDQLRLMMQSLLSEKFELSLHYETRRVPVYALVLDTGNFGPLLQEHAPDSPCPTTTIVRSPPPMGPPQTRDIRFPAPCGGILPMNASVSGRVRVGARNVTMELLADSFGGNLDGVDRPVIDRTNLTGTYDFAIEFTPESALLQPARNAPVPSAALPFRQALQEQLGLKLNPEIGTLDVPVIDQVEPLAN